MAADPAERYASAEALQKALKRYLQSAEGPGCGSPAWPDLPCSGAWLPRGREPQDEHKHHPTCRRFQSRRSPSKAGSISSWSSRRTERAGGSGSRIGGPCR